MVSLFHNIVKDKSTMQTQTTVVSNGEAYTVYDSDRFKACDSKNYHFRFNKQDGTFLRWGKSHKDDPDFGPAPELIDIEITTACSGINGKPCPWCYKSNTPNGINMSFETYKKIFHKLPATVSQIAFGVDSQCMSNPDCWKIFEYTRQNGVIPNVTVAQVDDETIERLSRVMGAVAVSRYDDKNICYDAVQKLGCTAFMGSRSLVDEKNGHFIMGPTTLRQVNIHILLAEETYPAVMETLSDIGKDERLNLWLNAVVLLSLKQKGRGTNMTPVSDEKFKALIKYVTDNRLRIGFDSCTCNKFLECVTDSADYAQYKMMAEPCESGCFSLYINAEGRAFPCSFVENAAGWENGIDLLKVKDFDKEVWNGARILAWRKNLLKCKRSCPVYNV